MHFTMYLVACCRSFAPAAQAHVFKRPGFYFAAYIDYDNRFLPFAPHGDRWWEQICL